MSAFLAAYAACVLALSAYIVPSAWRDEDYRKDPKLCLVLAGLLIAWPWTLLVIFARMTMKDEEP